MTAVGYVRRSKESGARTVSLEDQRARIEDHCRAQGWTLVEVLVDDGISGNRRERLTRLDAMVRQAKARVVVVYHLDRLARDAAALLDWLERAARRGIELHVVGRGRIEAETASGYLVAGVEGIVAAHYRKVIAEKTRDALGRLQAKGQRVSGHLPYGFKLAADGRSLDADPVEQAQLELIRRLAPGRSLRALARELEARGAVARNGRPFAARTLSRLVTDRAVGHNPRIDSEPSRRR